MDMSTFLGDRRVNRMGFGAMQLTGPGVFGPPRDPQEAKKVLRRAVELGVDHIDTAQFYGPDVVNELIREALYPYPAELKLVTKVGARRDLSGRVLAAQMPDELRDGVEANLRALGVERLDLVNLRLIETPGGGPSLEDQLGTLVNLRQEGKLALIGLSNVDEPTVRRALELVDVAEIQNSYSITDRAGEGVLELARELEIAFVPFAPLGSAFRAGPARLATNATIRRVAGRYRATVTQVALAWLLARYQRMLLIPGTGSIVHLEENLAAAEITFDGADLAELDAIATELP